MSDYNIVQNIVSAVFTNNAGSTISPKTLEALAFRDGTGENKVGFDNEASFRFFPKPNEGSIAAKFADPLQSMLLKNQAGTTAVITFANINGGSNIACTITNWMFKQPGNDESFANVIGFELDGRFGSVSYSTAS